MYHRDQFEIPAADAAGRRSSATVPCESFVQRVARLHGEVVVTKPHGVAVGLRRMRELDARQCKRDALLHVVRRAKSIRTGTICPGS